MIATDIGKIFLKAYNEKNKTSYTPKEFFVEIYYELFYNDNKYMMSAGNSPLENPKISWDKMRNRLIPYETKERRKERFEKTVTKIENEPADASIAIGFPSLDITATTSGQLTNLDVRFKADDVYLSWIGSGLGVGVQSGLSLFFNNKQILLDLFEGWGIYRKLLNETPQLRGNQINTWNGQWLAHRYSKSYDACKPTASFDPMSTMKSGDTEISTQSWTKVLYGIARTYGDTTETAYVYSLGQTNITVGFIPFNLPQIIKPHELYEKYFGTSDSNQVTELFGSAMGFTQICQMGTVGINAMEPKGFRECFEKGVIPKYNEDKRINYNTYKIWLLAMLNKKQLWEKSIEIVEQLKKYEAAAEKTRTNRIRNVKNFLETTTQKLYIEKLTAIRFDDRENEDLWRSFGEVVNLMPSDEFGYFITLIRFEYPYPLPDKNN